MLEWLFRFAAHWQTALGAFLFFVGSTIALDFVNPKKEIIEKLCSDYVSTDSKFFYDLGKAAHMFGRYREQGMNGLFAAHRRFLSFHDRIYPFCYAIPLVLLLAYFYPPGGGRQYGWLVFLPLLAMLFDFAENSAILSVLGAVETEGQVPLDTLRWARIFTVLKISLLLVSVLLVLGFAAYAQARLRELVARQ